MISKEHAVKYLEALLPDIDALLSRMQKDGGWLCLKPEAVQYLRNLRIANYAEHYVDERRVYALFAVGMAGEGEELREFVREFQES